MKLLLQRTLSEHPDGPYWIESARLEDDRLRGFLILERDGASYFEPRFDPVGDIFYLSDKGARVRLYQHAEAGSLTLRKTLRYAFSSEGELVSLQCEPSGPYGVVIEDGEPEFLESSATHLGFVPGTETLVVCTLHALYQGPALDLQEVPRIHALRFTLAPEALLYCTDSRLWRRPLGSEADEVFFAVADGTLLYPCWTPEGVWVSQEAPGENALWLIRNGEGQKVWSDATERVYICDWRATDPSTA